MNYISRSRITHISLMMITIALGLLSRSSVISLPGFLATYLGDTLWALMVFWMFCTIFSNHKTWGIALYAILFSYSIELSQLYHAPWIDEIRHFKIGGLILGYGFKASDLLCYATGIFIGSLIDISIIKLKKREIIR